MNHRDPAVRKNYDHTNRVLPFSPGHSRVNRLGSARLGSFARSRVRACFRPTLEKLSLLRLTVPSANFLLPSTCSRFTRPLSGSQFSHGCPGRDRACVMSECTRHEVEFRVFFERWMERSLLENWPFRKLPPEYPPPLPYFVPLWSWFSSPHTGRITLSILNLLLTLDGHELVADRPR